MIKLTVTEIYLDATIAASGGVSAGWYSRNQLAEIWRGMGASTDEIKKVPGTILAVIPQRGF